MKCPHCGKPIKDEWRSKGGSKSKREISPEAQRKMQQGRKKKLRDVPGDGESQTAKTC